jgi:hypothetical protein
LHYNISDEERIKLQVTQEQGQSIVDIGSELISFTGVTEGQYQVTLMAKDSFNEEAKFSILFTVFRNIAPIALFTVKKIGVSSPYEYEVDSSGSYDRDLLNGLLIAFLATFIDGIIRILGSGVSFDWPHIQPVLIAGISAALAYLLKSLSTNSRNQLFTKEP